LPWQPILGPNLMIWQTGDPKQIAGLQFRFSGREMAVISLHCVEIW